VAKQARIVSHANAFEIVGARHCQDAVRAFATGADAGSFSDSGSLLNGAPLAPCGRDAAAWTVPYPFTALPAGAVPAHVRAHAGAGKLPIQ
jgi:pectate lyase